jgi:spore protease
MYSYYADRENEGNIPYTDLAIERRTSDVSVEGVLYKREFGLFGVWERLKITSEEGARSLGRPKGIYDTLETSRMDLLDEESVEDAKEEISRELCYLCDVEDVYPEKVLIVGLGNGRLTPDSIGTKCADKIKPTMHIKEFDKEFFDSLECSEIAVIKPGVAANTGYDSIVAIRGICSQINPSLVIIIDSLASRSGERLGTTIQLSNTGIAPGSGIGNAKYAIDKASLGTPVISIGVPTIIDSRLFNTNQNRDEKITDLLPDKYSGMFVSPKEINDIVDLASDIIAGGINQAFGLFF